MYRRLTALLAIPVLATSLWAGDPWKEKPYTQWDEKDIRKVLTESPWVRAVAVENTWGGNAGRADAPTLGASASAASSDPRDVTREAKPLAGQTAEAVFLLHWASSRTIRRAQARNAVLRGVPPDVAEKFLAQEPAEYQIVVLGTDMTPFLKAEERELKERAYLAPRKSKTRLAPVRVQVERTGDASKIVAVHFYFPKKSEAGQATLSPEEKAAEFVCQTGRTTLKANFDLQKMADRQGADL